MDGYNNWLAFCFHSGEYSEQIINLKIDTPSYAQTKYPIMVVPGVLAYDNINVIIDLIRYVDWLLTSDSLHGKLTTAAIVRRDGDGCFALGRAK